MGIKLYTDLYKDFIEDQMTPTERIIAVSEGKPFDRLPCVIFVDDHASKLIGAKVRDIHLSGLKQAEAQIAAAEIYSTEILSAGPGMHGIAEVLGTELEFPDNRGPYVKKLGIKEYSDIDRIEVPDPLKAGRFPIVFETVERLKEKMGNKVPISIGVPGPFTTAANVRGTENIMKDLYKNPEFVHKLLRLATDTTIALIREGAKYEIDFGIYDPTSSGTLISENQFLNFAFPYLKEVLVFMKSASANAPSLHICGNTKKIWKHMAESGAGILSLDDVVDLEEAKHAIGDKVMLSGNVAPTEIMYLGSMQDVENEAKKCIRKTFDNPKGYILGLGCGLPYDAPSENVHALLHAARKYGKYPINPE